MFRRGLIGEIPAWYDTLFPITDWPLHILNAEHGCIGYIDRVMGVYRYHEGGLYSPLDESEKLDRMLAFYRAMDRNLDYRYTRIIARAISKYFFGWAAAYAARGEIGRARHCFGICLSGRPLNPAIVSRRPPIAQLRREISARPRVISADIALWPSCSDSVTPAAMAMMFFSAAPISTPTTSSEA